MGWTRGLIMKDFKLAVCQMSVTDDKQKNIEKSVCMIREAAANGAELVVLPEIFNCPYDTKCFSSYAESYPGLTSNAMMGIAKDLGIYLLAGSIPEIDGSKIYNTAYFYDRNGHMIARHRKMHLFDIDIDGGQYFKESDVLTPGDDFTLVNTDLGCIGIGMCYDVRFPEYFRILSTRGAEMVLLPAAFNMTTGPLHWEISLRVRALDNQIFMVGASSARDVNSSYVSYANSRIIDPWGSIIARTDEKESIIYADIDGSKIESVRNQLPLIKHLRKDRYNLACEVR